MNRHNSNRLLTPNVQIKTQNYRAQILNQIQKTTLILLSIAIILSFLWGFRTTPLILLIGFLMVIVTMIISHRKHVQLAATIITIGFLFIMNYLLYVGQGIHDEAVIAYPIIVMLSSLLLTQTLFIFTTFLTILSLGFITWAELNNWIETGLDGITKPFDFVATMLIIIFAAIIMQRVIHILTDALNLSQKSEHKLRNQTQALTQSEARWRSFTENAPLIIINTDLDGNINFTNLARLHQTKTIFNLLPPNEHGPLTDLLTQVKSKQSTAMFETAGFNWSKDIAWYDVHIGPVIDANVVTSLLFYIIDITDRKITQEELEHSEERLRQFVSQSSEAIWMVEYDPPISTAAPVKEQAHLMLEREFLKECNQAGSELYGFNQPKDIIGLPTKNIRGEENKSLLIKNMVDFIQSGYKFIAKESVQELPSGKRVFFLTNTVGIIKDGYLTSTWGSERDITAIRAAEQFLRKHMQELERSNRELRQFANVASHDLQEPLRKIQMLSDRLTTKYGDVFEDRDIDYLSRIQNASARMQRLIEDLLTYSTVSTEKRPFTTVNLNTIINNTLVDLEHQIKNINANIQVALLPEIEGDDIQLFQLFQNLISNAIKFHREDVAPLVYIQQVEAKAGFIAIEVADNGIGFDEKYRDRIFNMFQRLNQKTKYEGTGVGLAVCRRIVEHHGGKIDVRSQVGHGTTFTITLPIHKEIEQEQKNNE